MVSSSHNSICDNNAQPEMERLAPKQLYFHFRL